MKIAYAFHRDARNPAVQSSRPYSILRHLREAGQEIVEAFPLAGRLPRDTTLKKVLYRLRGQYYRGDRERSYLESIADQFDLKTAGKEYDIVFCPGSEAIAEMRTRRPIVFCADATFANMVDYYWDFTNLPQRYVARGHAQELGALNRASLAVYPSQWAADSAINDYGAPPSKIAVIPFGANLGAQNRRADVMQWISERPTDVLRILFVGRHWERKGGQLVLETARRLVARGLRVELHIVGCEVRGLNGRDEWIRMHGSLRADVPEDARILESLYRDAHFVFVPSRAEAFGMCFCEANAFGVPALGTKTGGIPQIIRPGKNGLLFDLHAEPAECADAIAHAFSTPGGYRDLAKRSFAEFESRLNWKSFCGELINRSEEIVERRNSAAGKPIRVAYLANRFLDPHQARSWSGTPFFIKRSLEEAGLEVIPVTGLHDSHKFLPWLRFMWWRVARRKRFLRDSDVSLLRSYARQAGRIIAELRPDIVFAPGAWPIAFLDTPVPIVLWTDATFDGVLDYYDAFSDLAPPSIRDGRAVERAALQRCAVAIYSSEWAAETARSYGAVDPARVVVIPFGANLSDAPTRETVERAIESRSPERCRLLLLGVDWERKGANRALAVAAELRRRGIQAQLTVAGCAPPRGFPLPDYVRSVGFLSKATEDGRRGIAALFSEADFFILPTRAEAYGLVFCEAAAFGLPVLATRTGGIPTVVEHGVTGMLFDPDASPEAYADAVAALLTDRAAYRTMARRARDAFEQRLNWQVAGARVAKIMEQALESRSSTAVPRTFPPPAPVLPEAPTRLRIGYVANDYLDPRLVKSWSGLAYFLRQAFEKHGVEVVPIPLTDGAHRAVVWIKFLYHRYVHRKRYLRDRDPALLNSYARQIERQSAGLGLDALFCPGTAPLAFVESSIPMVSWTDATFGAMLDFYNSYTNLAAVSIRDGHASDQATLRKCAVAIYSSQWAASDALQRYGADPSKVQVKPFGANFECEPTREEVEQAIERRLDDRCQLLFLGVDWLRKGADEAIAVTTILRERGANADLVIAGCQPPPGRVLPDYVRCLGFVSKATEEGRRLIEGLFRDSHFFILPTRAEAFGLVFCEASAFGLPSLATRVGGVGSIIDHGVNGALFDPKDSPEVYAEWILSMLADRNAYRAMARRARREYEERLNWDVSISAVVETIRRLKTQGAGEAARHA